MIEWRFGGGNPALETVSGARGADRLTVRGDGRALYGPYLDVPAGRLTARILLDGASRGTGRIDIVADKGGRILAEREVDLAAAGHAIELSAELAEPATDLEVRLDGEDVTADIVGLEIDLAQPPADAPVPGRPVGYESSKTYADKIGSGFWRRYAAGPAVLEVGYKGYYGRTVPIVPQAIGVDIGYPGYDGVTLPFADASFDAIYSSHCLEHIPDYIAAIRDWYRLLKVGGHIITVVPHQHLFEKRAVMPSLSNPDHRRFYTAESLLREFAEALPENSYRVRHLRENDEGFDYAQPPRRSGGGCFEIELVVEKIAKPNWNSDDNTVRHYSAGEYFADDSRRPTAWTIEVDFGRTDRCVAYGPYATLRPAHYVAEFHFGAIDVESLGDAVLLLDVAGATERVAAERISGEEGLRRLRAGVIEVPFTVESTDHYEFRLYREGGTAAGSARFRGVVLRYA